MRNIRLLVLLLIAGGVFAETPQRLLLPAYADSRLQGGNGWGYETRVELYANERVVDERNARLTIDWP